MHSKFRKSARAMVVIAAIATLAAACGDDSGSSSSATTAANTSGGASTTAGGAATTAGGTATTTANPLGTPNKATGSPVKIGYITEGLSANVDNTGEKLAAEATFKYANDYLGGLGGHVIDPVVCESKLDPALGVDCANQMVQEKVAAVVIASLGVINVVAPPLQQAGIPVFGWQVVSPVSSNKESGFIMSNALTAFILPAAVAQQQKLTKFSTLVTDTPGATGPAKTIGVALMKGAGVTQADVVAIPAGTPDFGPQVQAEIAKGTQGFHLIGDPTFCTAAFRAINAAKFTGTVTAIAQCLNDSTIKAIGSGLKGVQVGYPGTQDPADPDVQLGTAVIAKYGDPSKSTMSNSNDLGGFAVVANFMQLMKGLTGDITPASLITKAKTSPVVPQILGAGGTLKCDGTKIPILPAECANALVVAELGADGQPLKFVPFDPTQLIANTKLG